MLNAYAEKKLSESFKLFAEYEYEQALSNILYDQYAVNRVWGGIEWEF
jgi:hypothetical protein